MPCSLIAAGHFHFIGYVLARYCNVIYNKGVVIAVTDRKTQAFKRLMAIRDEAIKYLPDNFDPDVELESALEEKYGSAEIVNKKESDN